MVSTSPEPAQAHIFTVILAMDLNGSANTFKSPSSASALSLRP